MCNAAMQSPRRSRRPDLQAVGGVGEGECGNASNDKRCREEPVAGRVCCQRAAEAKYRGADDQIAEFDAVATGIQECAGDCPDRVIDDSRP